MNSVKKTGIIGIEFLPQIKIFNFCTTLGLFRNGVLVFNGCGIEFDVNPGAKVKSKECTIIVDLYTQVAWISVKMEFDERRIAKISASIP